MTPCQGNWAGSHRPREHRAGQVRVWAWGCMERRAVSCRQNGAWVLPLIHCVTLEVCLPSALGPHLSKEGLEGAVTEVSSSSRTPGSGRR